jgi:hypothetical protein
MAFKEVIPVYIENHKKALHSVKRCRVTTDKVDKVVPPLAIQVLRGRGIYLLLILDIGTRWG